MQIVFFDTNFKTFVYGIYIWFKSLLLSLIHIAFKKKFSLLDTFFDLEMNVEDIENLKNGHDFFIVKKFLKNSELAKT